MSTYSDLSFNSKHYNSSRPSYPDEFYDTLIGYHDKSNYDNNREIAIDIGCGSGFVSFKLLDFFNKVIGTDLSPTMIGQCKDDTRAIQFKNRIKFIEGSAEHQPSGIESNSIDLITGAECCHWVDHPKFFRESFRVLKPGATVAYWFYNDPIFIGFPKANEIYTNYTYNSSIELNSDEKLERYMGPYWEQPGRNILRTLMKEVEVPCDLYEDVVRHEFNPLTDGKDPSKTTLYISRKTTLKYFLDYVKSWSAYHAWMKEHGDKYDVAEAFINELKTELGWDDDFKFEIVWPTVYTFARKKCI